MCLSLFKDCKEQKRTNYNILMSVASATSDTQLVVQFVFCFATLLQITRLIVRRIGWRKAILRTNDEPISDRKCAKSEH